MNQWFYSQNREAITGMFKKLQEIIMGTKEYDESIEKLKIDQEIEDIPKRAIINGLLYDTSKSQRILKIYDWIGSFCLVEQLYVTPNNRFFTECQSVIEPKTEDEVKQILSKYPDKYQEIFGEVENA